jgi:flagellar biosynthesis protein FlhA
LIGALKLAAERVAARGQQPIILCSPILRRHIRRLTDRVLSTVPVLAPNEIDGMATIKSAETIRIGDEAA